MTAVNHPGVRKEERSSRPDLKRVIANGISPRGATGVLRDHEIWSIVLCLHPLPRRAARANTRRTRIEP